MASFSITATVSHSGGSMSDALDEMMDDNDMEMVVVHGPGACGPCRANDNWRNVPCVECVGNVAGHHMESVHAQAVGNLCQCRVEMRRKGDRDVE